VETGAHLLLGACGSPVAAVEDDVMSIAPIIQALTTLVLGIVAALIAWRQWRTSQDRVVLDLFERRFQVFQELGRAISAAFNKLNPEASDLANFDVATEKARFLFGAEVHSYLIEVRKHLIDLITMGRATLPIATQGMILSRHKSP
jgi:hypothetical protein